jgi:hypothetical protein
MLRCWFLAYLLLLLLLLDGATSSQTMPGMNGCDAKVSCQEVEANGLTFQCRKAGREDGTPVVLLHGCVRASIFMLYGMPTFAARMQKRIRSQPISLRKRGVAVLVLPTADEGAFVSLKLGTL